MWGVCSLVIAWKCDSITIARAILLPISHRAIKLSTLISKLLRPEGPKVLESFLAVFFCFFWNLYKSTIYINLLCIFQTNFLKFGQKCDCQGSTRLEAKNIENLHILQIFDIFRFSDLLAPIFDPRPAITKLHKLSYIKL